MSENGYSAELTQDALLDSLPLNEGDAICAEDLFKKYQNEKIPNLGEIRNRETFSRNLDALYRRDLCSRISRFKEKDDAHTRFYYWKTFLFEELPKNPTLLSERIKVILKSEGYTIPIHAETAFVDLVYLYKSYQKTNTLTFMTEFTKWFLSEVKRLRRSEEIKLYIIQRLSRSAKYLIEQNKNQGKKKSIHKSPYHSAQSIDMSNSALGRIKSIEEDIARIHKRYEEVEKAIQEKELDTQLSKLKQLKEVKQRKLDLLEERLRKWSADEAKVKENILK